MQYIIRISETVAVNHIATFTTVGKNEIVADFEGETPIFFLNISEDILQSKLTLADAKDMLFEYVKKSSRDCSQAVRLAKQIMYNNELIIDNFRAVIIPVQ